MGTYDTLLEPDEILTRDPHPGPRGGHRLVPTRSSSARPATSPPRRPRCAADEGRQGRATSRIALTNVGATPLKARAAEDVAAGKALDDAAIAEAARLAMSICDPAADQRGDADYKTAMAGEMTRRALAHGALRAARA